MHNIFNPRIIIIENKGGRLLHVLNYQMAGSPRLKC